MTSEFLHTKILSRRMYKVLEDIGVSTQVRDVVSRARITGEILQSLRSPVCWYVFGSSAEGTTSHGIKSDIDNVLVHKLLPVITNIAEAQQNLLRPCLLLVQDSYTPAGYAKLQQVTLGVPQYGRGIINMYPFLNFPGVKIDSEDRFLLARQRDNSPFLQQHGPAENLPESQNFVARDFVPAVKSSTWPDCASKWLVRERNYNWPSQEQLDTCKTLGCFFVQVGHPNSDEKHLQWRLSFSLQERLLVTDFNSVQLKCCILLKMIKKERIHKSLGEKSLTSYHFKTCMLYMVENTPAEFWTEENLLVCLHHCLQQMLVWTETGVCPNYFIPEENMFEGRVFGQLRIRICEILRLLLSADFKFLLNIKTDMLGIRFQEALVSGRVASGYGQTVAFPSAKAGYAAYRTMLSLRGGIFAKYQNTASSACAQNLSKLKDRLSTPGLSLYDHSVTETRDAMSFIVPYIDITLMSIKLVEAKQKSASNESIISLLTSEQWHVVSLGADQFSAKLKQASALCMLAHCELSLEILRDLEGQLEQQISVCGCFGLGLPGEVSIEESLPVISACSYEDLLHRHFIPCVVYLPAERDLTPPALCYEMDRSVASSTENKMYWYDWAVVDGKVLFYFLLYLNHDHLGMEENAQADIESIWRLLYIGEPVGHPETMFNILGWIMKERGSIIQAQTLFWMSRLCRPTHNAALLHLQDMNNMVDTKYSHTCPKESPK